MPVTVRGTFQNKEREKFHPTKKREVLAIADVMIKQVQLIDKTGLIRSVVMWQCGTDMLYATTMDGLFDEARRRPVPKWMVEKLRKVPPENVYDYMGESKTGTKMDFVEPSHTPNNLDEDEDVPEFMQK